MPLVILGLIVVLGVAFLIYYQLGPKSDRLKGGLGSLFGFGGGGGDSSPSTSDSPDGEDASENEDVDISGEKSVKSLTGDEKVLYIFGDGEREERPLDKNDGQDSNS